MFYHVKELQFNARVSEPDPRFASLLLEQFGGPNGELKAAMQYFLQAFSARQPYPDKYDMLMDIATEEFSHLEIVGATITMLLDGVNGELKNAADSSFLMKFLSGNAEKEQMIHQAMVNPQFLALSGGGPRLTLGLTQIPSFCPPDPPTLGGVNPVPPRFGGLGGRLRKS
jgi:Mn-containing catalase